MWHYYIYIQSSLPKQVLQSMHPSTTQLQNSIGDFTEDSWNQECDSIPGFHCTDIIPVENIYDCYSYDLWDIECPEVKYKSKYCSPHLPHEGTEEKAVKQKNRCNEKNDEVSERLFFFFFNALVVKCWH